MTTITYEQAEILKQGEHITDDDGIERPIFHIAGKNVAFRTRQEMPSFVESGQLYHIASPLDAVPLILEQDDDPKDFTPFSEASQEVSGEGIIEMVTATPEGLVGAAIEMGSTDVKLLDVQESLRSGQYSVDALRLIDTMIATMYFSSEGKKLPTADTEGHALVLSALLGNEQASAALDERLESMYAFFDAQRAKTEAEVRNFTERELGIESIDPREVVLVHNTSHDVFVAEDGSVVLRSASAYREDKFPRSSLHFTPNGSVSDNYARVDGKNSRYIVANFADTVTTNDHLPTSMYSGDTYFTLNPGDSLTLPDARIVEGSLIINTKDLIEQNGAVITYKDIAHYTEREESEIKQLAKEHNLDLSRGMTLNAVLRTVALRKAMQQKGAKRFVEIGTHYVEDSGFQDQYDKLAGEMGVPRVLHESTGDARIEVNANHGMTHAFARKHYSDESYRTFLSDTRLESLRQVFASGYIPARPFASTHSVAEDEGVFI